MIFIFINFLCYEIFIDIENSLILPILTLIHSLNIFECCTYGVFVSNSNFLNNLCISLTFRAFKLISSVILLSSHVLKCLLIFKSH